VSRLGRHTDTQTQTQDTRTRVYIMGFAMRRGLWLWALALAALMGSQNVEAFSRAGLRMQAFPSPPVRAPGRLDGGGVSLGAAARGAGGAVGLLHPVVVQRMREIYVESGENHPMAKQFFADYEAAGPFRAMEHMSNPEVSADLARLMGLALGHKH